MPNILLHLLQVKSGKINLAGNLKKDETWQGYVNKMSKDRAYADMPVLIATSYLFQRDIHLISKWGIHKIETHPKPKSSPYLIGWRPEHYYSLLYGRIIHCFKYA